MPKHGNNSLDIIGGNRDSCARMVKLQVFYFSQIFSPTFLTWQKKEGTKVSVYSWSAYNQQVPQYLIFYPCILFHCYWDVLSWFLGRSFGKDCSKILSSLSEALLDNIPLPLHLGNIFQITPGCNHNKYVSGTSPHLNFLTILEGS